MDLEDFKEVLCFSHGKQYMDVIDMEKRKMFMPISLLVNEDLSWRSFQE